MIPAGRKTIKLFDRGAKSALKITFGLATTLLALSACGKVDINQQHLEKQGQDAARPSTANAFVDFSRVKLADSEGHELDPSVLEKPLVSELKVNLDGQRLTGESQNFKQLSLCKKLAARMQSKLDGTFLSLPWGKSKALVGGFAAISLANDPGKILLCGGDESPNHVRFAADNTWLVDLSSGKVSVGPDMHWARRFPTLSALRDGRVLISGGSGGHSSGDRTLTGAGLEKLPLEVEIYDPQTNTISPAGTLRVPRDETAVVVLASGLALIVGGDRPRDEKMDPILLSPKLPTAELYNPQTKQSTMLGPLISVTAVTWAAPVARGQALLLGPHCGMRLDNKDVSTPAAELIDVDLANK